MINFKKYNDYYLYPHQNRDMLLSGFSVNGDSRNNYAVHTLTDHQSRAEVLRIREKLYRRLGFNGIVTLKQIHSNDIIIVDKQNIDELNYDPFTEGDGLITGLKDVLLGILTADCVPVHYSGNDFTGIAHAGWKGVLSKIHLGMLDAISSRFNTPLSDVEVRIGPHIRVCCYEVSRELIDLFADDTNNADYFEERDGRFYLNLESIIRHDLITAGVPEPNILSSGFCSHCSDNPEFFSYRNGDKTERMISFIGMKSGMTRADSFR